MAAALGGLPGCATVAPPRSPLPGRCWTDVEQLVERTRLLAGISEDRALAAAERLLSLAGGADARIERAPHEIAAALDRRRTLYLFLVATRAEVHERWVVATRAWPDGSEVCVQVTGHYFSDTFVLGAEPVVNVLYPASTTERERSRMAAGASARGRLRHVLGAPGIPRGLERAMGRLLLGRTVEERQIRSAVSRTRR